MKTLTLSRRILLGSTLAAALPAARASDGITPRQIIIGQPLTLQGGKNEYGVAVQDGVATCLNATNARGGVHGRVIVLRTLDDDNQASKSEALARDLVTRDKVFLLFGSIEGGPSTAVMKAATDLKVPFFGPMAGSPTLRRPLQPMVFPVRAEHREEFRALLEWARKTGMQRVGFFRADSETGLQHLENMRLLCTELGLQLSADLAFKSDIGDAQIDALATRLASSGTQVVINHGSAAQYEKLIRRARAQGLRTTFSGVNSGSTQMARHLGELAHGMVFSQVVPSPWERKTAITREYQDAFAREHPGKDFSYGSLEGYLTAKALVAALQLTGPNPTREGFVQALHAAGGLDLAGLRAVYTPSNHAGLSLVDLSIVTREGKFRH